MSRRYTGINIQYPISQLIVNGKKSIETRTYPIPEKYLGQEMLLIETPGKSGNFKSRIIAIIKFTNCFIYKSKQHFYLDYEKHFVDESSSWSWGDKPKYGWSVVILKKIDPPLPYLGKKGIKFTLNLTLKDPN